jgi:hypothetical protein
VALLLLDIRGSISSGAVASQRCRWFEVFHTSIDLARGAERYITEVNGAASYYTRHTDANGS